MRWSHLTPILSPYFHILCRLPWEVRNVILSLDSTALWCDLTRVLLASIRDKGMRPCPRCLVSKEDIRKLGLSSDRRQRRTNSRVDDLYRQSKITSARRIIYEENYRINSAAVERILKEESLVPNLVGRSFLSAYRINSVATIKNAFSERLSNLGFNFFQILAVDLLHEFELGVWKALFTHLLRLLAAINPSLLNELDQRWGVIKNSLFLKSWSDQYRYRQIPPFGQGTIRKFSSNTSEMKKMAARDFEDILQVSCPNLLELWRL